MIPWDTFKNAQDAYEWAKARAGNSLFMTGGLIAAAGWSVWTSTNGWVRHEITLPVRQ